MRSASVQLERGGPQQNTQPPLRQLLSFTEKSARPRVLRLQLEVRTAGLSSEQQEQLARAAGCGGVAWSRENGTAIPWLGGALLRVVCGSSPGVYRTLYADLRAGEYTLPACETVEVSAAYWRTTVAPDELGDAVMGVQAEVTDGELPDPSPLLLTCVRRKPWDNSDVGGDPYARCPVPPGAWGWDLLPGGLSRVIGICGGQKAVRVEGDAWTPPTTPIVIGGLDTRWVRIAHDVPAPEQTGDGWDAGVIFSLR